MRSVRVTVQDPPDDYDLLRADHPNAYRPWHQFLPTDLSHLQSARATLAKKVRQLGRPPEHIVAKAREFGYDFTDLLAATEPEPEPDPDSLAARRESPWTRHDYIVFAKHRPNNPHPILSRHHVAFHDLYRLGSFGFSAVLTGEQIQALARRTTGPGRRVH